jgi:hypothetical protein
MSDPITITRALAELKTLQQRIDKIRNASVFITYKVRDEEKAKITKDNLQRIRDLMNYRKKLKSAIVQSNATTNVEIMSEKYTVAEAIERKRSIELEKQLLREMKSQFASVTQKVETQNQRVQQKLDRLLEVEFGKDVKSNVENVKTISDSYLKSNKVEVVDPLGLENVIDKLEEDILNFETEVDLVLSESNATTKILVK